MLPTIGKASSLVVSTPLLPYVLRYETSELELATVPTSPVTHCE